MMVAWVECPTDDVQPPTDPPAANAKVQGFGTGTGAILYHC